MSKELIPYSKDRYRYILIALMVILGIILFKELRVYLSSFMGAATLYVLLTSQMVYLVEKKKIGRGYAAAILTLEALLLFLIPLTGIAFLVIDTVSGISIDPKIIIDNLNEWAASMEERFGIDMFRPQNIVNIPRLGTNILQTLGASIYSLMINSIFILFILYYMLYNYKQFGEMIEEILPFREENKAILSEETKRIIQANAIGIPLLGAIQGFVAYLGYLFFGIENALLYGILTGFASIIPVFGTAAIWLPLSIGLFIDSKIASGIMLLIYGTFIIGGVDNVARLFLQKLLADIHPLITIIGVIMGIPMFGFWGVIFGPLLLSLFVLMFNMYRHDYIPGSTAEPRVTTRMKGGELKVPPLKKKKKEGTEATEKN